MENKQCIQCSKSFRVTERDAEFYSRIAVPAPTHCPDCRAQRRMAWRNERNFYKDKCGLCSKTMLSNFKPGNGFTVYCQECYRSDKWDATTYKRDIDWSRPFFEQLAELYKAVPQISSYGIRSENSEYCNYVGDAKNSYLCFGSIFIEDCLYGSPYHSKQCVDSLLIRECELCYECITSERLYHCFWCQDCFDSRDLYYCYDVKNSHDCFGCVGIRNAQYMIYNKQYTELEYRQFIEKVNWCDHAKIEKVQTEFRKIVLKTPHRFMTGIKNESVTGNYINESTQTHFCFDAARVEQTAYSAQVIDMKDCYDNNYTEENELCYEYWGNYHNNHCLFSAQSYSCANMFYSILCEYSKELFGCIGMRKAQYSVLT